MAIFQTKKIQSVIVFIIVLVAILWIFQDNILSISDFEKSTKESEFSEEQIKDTPYLEKIDNFIIKEYSSDQVLLHTIEADVYKSFKNSPVQLDTVKVTTFDEKQDETLTLTSNRAVLFKSGTIHFIGEVEIKTVSGISHEIDTELLVVKGDQINSNRDVFYLGEKAKIRAQGMDMNINSDLMNLNGDVEIIQDNGATLVTKNLFISHSLGEKRYESKEKTVYRSKENIANSDKGVDINMNLEQTKLLGDVTVVNGFGSSLTSYNLIIDQSNGSEIFKSNSPSRFQSNTVDIRAKKMHYDAIAKKLKLTDEVVATYE
ncbi:MAG: LPS export ABC transporter periplasmic protein LptC [Thiotrichales bacterium]|jgi:LPS export ABC transporter protein LptC|nr:LPS export ABC transporter periplasmic protein LptC [Thiotrichales bacterium]MBT3854321.1 LPS export ABC transporter periplasmic protein LptC [Thiotrichales bacterium]MBT4653014.1 LPS export ABC transporter periplasmic protein LptC [Thiotrichales bacterium]MBT5499834.1 LPS export ABC transporter periplasmic protein LptC [Thiotrichales bacterium]MBT5984460.1 LPS export ABC transporter periplasmic protein LptC [Thiotrichales bacterium]